MKLIDEKGRLFGRINIVDFLIVTLVIILIPAFFHIYRILGKTPIRVPSEWIKVEAVAFTIPEIADLFKPGDISYDRFGNMDGKLARVIDIDDERIRRYMHLEDIREENKNLPIVYSMPVLIEFELLCTRDEKNQPWYYRRAPLVVSLAKSFVFSSDKYDITCYAIKVRD